MSKVRVGLVVAVVLAAVVLAGVWATLHRPAPENERSSNEDPPATEQARSGSEPTPSPVSGVDAGTDSEEEPRARLPAIPAPTAEWLRAPANPLRVTVQLNDRTQEKRVSPAGDTLSTTTSDGTRVTLLFPPGSLWRSEEITIQAVEGVGESPFSSMPLAVHISPEDLALRRPPLLHIEPGRRSTFDGGRMVAGFAVRGGSELTLYPAGHYEIERAPGRYRAAMALTRLGTYGITNATSEEIAAVAQREPSDLGARLEQRIALAYAEQAPTGEQASRASAWTIIPAVHAQGVSLFIYELVKQLLDYYQQVVVPKFDKLPTNDCLSGATFDAIQTYLRWQSSVQLLLPLEKDADLYQSSHPGYRESFDKVAAQRETKLRERGYTPEQIDEINRTMEQFRAQFDQLTAAIESRIRPALSGQFQALYRCCTTQRPMQYHLTAMVKVLRFAEMNGYVPVDADPMQKLKECACLVGSNEPGAQERFTGTLSYEESHSLDKTVKNGVRTQVNSESLTFQQSAVLTFPRAGGMLADSTSSGKLSRFSSTTDDRNGCTVHNESHLEVDGRDNDVEVIGINVNSQQGRYSVHLNRLHVEGSGQQRHVWNVKGPACGVFNRARDESRPAYQGVGPLVPITGAQGEIDPKDPYTLKGSHVFEQRDNFYNITRTGTLKWELHRCKRD